MLATAACAEPSREENDWPVDKIGRHAVGYSERTLTYMPEGAVEARRLRLAVWYPTAATTGRKARYMELWERPEIFAEAPPVEGRRLPIVIFSHGSTSFAEESWFLAEHLASHGYLVAAPDHLGNTLHEIADARPAEVFLLRPRDLSATLDHLRTLEAPDPLAGRTSDEVFALGHSLGGFTALALAGARLDLSTAACPQEGRFACELPEDIRASLANGVSDRRVLGALAMAPGNFDAFGASGVSALGVPVLLMTAQRDRQLPADREGDRYWASLSDPRDRRIDLENGGHHSFDVICDVFPAIGAGDGCGPGFMSPADAHRVIETYALAFARRTLFDDTTVSDLLDGATSPFEETRVFRK